jgi:endogenous inhibitor of DNA gyrase (YacG/DUF329 family)
MHKEEKTSIGNCPHCTKIIFKDAIFNSEASFSMRCPHCNKPVKVIIKHRVEIILIAIHEPSTHKKTGPGSGIVMVILVLYLPAIMNLMHHMDNIIDIVT